MIKVLKLLGIMIIWTIIVLAIVYVLSIIFPSAQKQKSKCVIIHHYESAGDEPEYINCD